MKLKNLGLTLKLMVGTILAYHFSLLASQFSHLSICDEYLLPNVFFLMSVLVPAVLVLIYINKFPLISFTMALCGVPLYLLYLFYPQKLYIESFVQKVCDAYSPDKMYFGNWSDYDSIITFFSKTEVANYFSLFGCALLISLVGLISLLRPLRQKPSESNAENEIADENQAGNKEDKSKEI